MHDDIADRIDVRGDGRVILYKRPGLKNPKWQARIRVPNATGCQSASKRDPLSACKRDPLMGFRIAVTSAPFAGVGA